MNRRTAGSLSTLSLVLALVSCGVEAPAPEEVEVAAAESELGSTETVITFHADRNISMSNLIVAGGRVRVKYEEGRLTACRGSANGNPAWTITGYYQINGGPVGSFEAGGFSPSGGTAPVAFDVPSEGRLALWFQNNDRWGCNAWDSNLGNNYQFVIQSVPTLSFRADWTTAVSGTPGAASVLRVNYDLSRLPTCRQGYNGFATWEILAFARFDGGAVVSLPVTTPSGMGRVPAPANFALPAGTGVVELWFKNTDRGGCLTWDSNWGYNYRFVTR